MVRQLLVELLPYTSPTEFLSAACPVNGAYPTFAQVIGRPGKRYGGLITDQQLDTFWEIVARHFDNCSEHRTQPVQIQLRTLRPLTIPHGLGLTQLSQLPDQLSPTSVQESLQL